MQLAISVCVILVGGFIALVANAPADLRLFGWVLVGIGVLGLAVKWVLANLGRRGEPPGRSGRHGRSDR